MGVTVTIKTRDGLAVATPLGYEIVADVTFDTDYASSGGEAIDPNSDLLIPKEASVVSVSCSSSGGFVFDYDQTTEKIIAYWQTDSDNGVPLGEVTAGANALDGIVSHLHVIAAVV